MFYSVEDLTKSAEIYCSSLGMFVQELLGKGLQGMVFLSSKNTAIKVHSQKEAFNRELQVYGRLSKFRVSRIRNFAVPLLKAFDSSLLILEMSIVKPPFVVDFGGAYLDRSPDYAKDSIQIAEWMRERKDKFGDNFNEVNGILAEFEALYGIYLTDVHPGNIRFSS